MINKLPVVGKRYKSDDPINFPEIICMDITYSHLNGIVVWGNSSIDRYKYNLDLFWNIYEELPKDNQIHTSNTHQLSDEVKEAMEELNEELGCWMPTKDKEEYQLTTKAQNLLNALDNQFNTKLEVTDGKIQTESSWIIDTEKSDSVEELFEDLEEKSIWKPVSELPKKSIGEHLIVMGEQARLVNYHVHEGKWTLINADNLIVELEKRKDIFPKFTTLTDLINDYEDLKKRVTKLEGK